MISLRVFVICCAALGVICSENSQEDPIWRDGDCDDTSIRSITYSYPQEDIELLHWQINHTCPLTPALEDTQWQYGFNTNTLNRWIQFWVNDYDFEEHLATVNQYPHYMTNIQGMDIHFVRVSAQDADDCDAIPILFLHGFPDSFLTFYPLVEYLSEVRIDGRPLELIIPSLPGYGKSEGATKTGFGAAEVATVMKNLMVRLGFNEFYVQSGDCWQIGSTMASLYPEHTLGLHAHNAVSYHILSMMQYLVGAISPSDLATGTTAERMFPISDLAKHLMLDSGFFHMACTKPDTFGSVMGSSPVAITAFNGGTASILDRRDNMYQTNGGLEERYGISIHFDHINTYYFSDCMTTALRLFAETYNMRNFENGFFNLQTSVPTWVTQTKNDEIVQSESQLRVKYQNLMGIESYDDYGHYFPIEAPEVFSKSLVNAITIFEDYHKNKDNRCEL